MHRDITTRADIEQLVIVFYTQVKVNSLIGPIFNQAIKNWDDHLPTMFNFWETLLLNNSNYKGNPLLKHAVLHKKFHLSEAHFEEWIKLWEATIDGAFTGPTSEAAKAKAKNIGSVMRSHFAPKTP